jgi:hypothetical protein
MVMLFPVFRLATYYVGVHVTAHANNIYQYYYYLNTTSRLSLGAISYRALSLLPLQHTEGQKSLLRSFYLNTFQLPFFIPGGLHFKFFLWTIICLGHSEILTYMSQERVSTG